MFFSKFINVCNNVILKVLVDNKLIYIPNWQVFVGFGSPGECWEISAVLVNQSSRPGGNTAFEVFYDKKCLLSMKVSELCPKNLCHL